MAGKRKKSTSTGGDAPPASAPKAAAPPAVVPPAGAPVAAAAPTAPAAQHCGAGAGLPAKLMLELLPRTKAAKAALEHAKQHPYQALTFRCSKPVRSILTHLETKWGSGAVLLRPMPKGCPALLRGMTWTLENCAKDLKASDIFVALGSPATFRLSYDLQGCSNSQPCSSMASLPGATADGADPARSNGSTGQPSAGTAPAAAAAPVRAETGQAFGSLLVEGDNAATAAAAAQAGTGSFLRQELSKFGGTAEEGAGPTPLLPNGDSQGSTGASAGRKRALASLLDCPSAASPAPGELAEPLPKPGAGDSSLGAWNRAMEDLAMLPGMEEAGAAGTDDTVGAGAPPPSGLATLAQLDCDSNLFGSLLGLARSGGASAGAGGTPEKAAAVRAADSLLAMSPMRRVDMSLDFSIGLDSLLGVGTPLATTGPEAEGPAAQPASALKPAGAPAPQKLPERPFQALFGAP
eukprot:jgi/Tetstr1/430345/TSEL_001970.t1